MGWYRTDNWELGDGVAGYRLRHDDPRVDAVLKNVAVDSLMQAVGRMRSVRREKMGRVFIMHSMRLDLGLFGFSYNPTCFADRAERNAMEKEAVA